MRDKVASLDATMQVPLTSAEAQLKAFRCATPDLIIIYPSVYSFIALLVQVPR